MKKVILSLAMSLSLVGFSGFAQSLNLGLSTDCQITHAREALDVNGLLSQLLTGVCTSGNQFTVQGYGLNIMETEGSKVKLACPFVAEPAGEYYGVESSAGIVLGLHTASFVGLKGVCVMAGFSEHMTGVSGSVGKLDLK
jgi:hypothetical protein